jgi:hypothetical protein
MGPCHVGRPRRRPDLKWPARTWAEERGNALAVCCQLGFAGDERVRLLSDSLRRWQWPDGGWNCDVKATGRHSSFHKTLPAAWGLQEYALATGDEAGRRAVPFPSPVPLALLRHGHQVGVARPPLSAVLPLRHPPGPAHPRAARLCHRSPRRGRRRRPCASSVRGRHLGAREGVGGSKWEQATTAAAASWPRRPRWSTGAGQGQTR